MDNLFPKVQQSEPPHTQSLIKLTVTSRWSHSTFAPHFQGCCFSLSPPPSTSPPQPREAAPLIVTKTLALFAQTTLSSSTASLRPPDCVHPPMAFRYKPLFPHLGSKSLLFSYLSFEHPKVSHICPCLSLQVNTQVNRSSLCAPS